MTYAFLRTFDADASVVRTDSPHVRSDIKALHGAVFSGRTSPSP
jgi:hypothetical protein